VGPGHHRSINAIFSLKSYLPFDVLPAWRELRELPFGRAEAASGRSGNAPPTDRREAAMKPRDNVMQGGGAATTIRASRTREPLRDAGRRLDDPTIAQLAAQRGLHRSRSSSIWRWRTRTRSSCSPLVNEHLTTCSAWLRHPPHAGDRSPIRVARLPGEWAPRCKRTC